MPSTGYMFTAAVGASIGLLSGYAVARPAFYKWATSENMTAMQNLALQAAVELAEGKQAVADLDAVTTEVEIANEEQAGLQEELGMMEATDG